MIRTLRAALALVAIAALPFPTAAQSAAPLKVGILFSFSDVGTAAGRDLNTTLRLFQKRFGDTVAGRKIEFIERDEGGIAPERARRLAQELILQDHVDLLAGLLLTPNAVAVGDVSTQAKIPTFIMNATTSGIMTKNPYMSRYSMSQTQVTIPLARYAYRSGARNAYVLFMNYGPGIDSGTTFENVFTGEGGKIAGEIRMPLNTTDFSPFIQRVKDAKADSLYVYINSGGTAPLFLKQAKQMGLQAAGLRIFCSGDLVTEQELPILGEAATGLISSMNYSTEHSSKLNSAFVRAFLAESGGIPPTFAAVGVYDTLAAIYKIVELQQGRFDPERTMALVKALKFESPRGPIAIDAGSRDIVQNIYIRRVDAKGAKLVNTEIETYPMVRDPSERGI